MTIVSSDGKMFVEIGSSTAFFSLLSTVSTRLKSYSKHIPLALKFMADGFCAAEDCFETARQFNLIRDKLTEVPVDKIVYDMNNPKLEAPWKNNISGIVTSCGNFYTTSEGKDMLVEIVSILTYGAYAKVSIETT